MILGIIAFIMYLLYDLDSIKHINRVFHKFFGGGIVLLMVSTAGIFAGSYQALHPDIARIILCGIPAGIFFALLIYTLFFALPFDEVYLNADTGPARVCKTGMYALCRHPGVLWLTGFYIFLAAAVPTASAVTAYILFSALNILYVVLQDVWTFPRTFSEYGEYKKETPFLLPTYKSLCCCIQTLRG